MESDTGLQGLPEAHPPHVLRPSRPRQTVESDAGLQGLPEAHCGIACTRAPRQQHMQDEGLDMNSARFGVSGCQLSVAVAAGAAGKKRVACPHPTCVAGVADISTPFLDICHNKLLALLLLTPVFEMFCIRLSQEKGASRQTCKGNLQADISTPFLDT